MTVNASTGLGGPYNGNGVQVAFAFGFKIYAESDLEVIQTDAAGVETVKTLTTHYTVSAGPWPTGGTVTMLVAPPTGQTLTIRQNIPNTQSLDYTEGSKFPANSHEDGLDRLTLMVQAIVRDQLRALVVPKSESVAAGDMTLPPKAVRANRFSAWDGDGRPIAAAGTSANLTPVSAYINTLLDDADAATARATLGVNFRGALVKRTGNFTLTTSVEAAIEFTTEEYDTDIIHDNATNNTRLTVPSGVTKVRLHGSASFTANATGYRLLRIAKNGSISFGGRPGNIYEYSPNVSTNTDLYVSTPVLTVVAGDYFELKALQTSGGNLDILGAASQPTWFAMEIIPE